MLSVDLAVCADDCCFAQIEVSRGIMAGRGATLRMPQRAGRGNAMKLLLTGAEFDADEALRLKFVQDVVAPGEESACALGWAQRIADQAPLAVQATLENARLSLTHGMRAAINHIEPTQERLYNSGDAREGVPAFIERRPARYVGS